MKLHAILLAVLFVVVWGKTLDEQLIDAVTDVSALDVIQSNETLLVELDIILTAADWDRRRKRRKRRRKYGAIRDGLWTNGVVPYESIGTEFSDDDVIKIEKAMADYHRYTCIRFRKARADQREKIYFYSGRGCSSAVGMSGTRQPVSLARGCRHHGIIIHELGHAVGLNHEQSRPDRDSYVTIVDSNIEEDMIYNFDKYDRDYIDSRRLPYDYLSIMHYGDRGFAINRKRPTIRTHDPAFQDKIGQRTGLSFEDIQVLNIMYKCAKHCDTDCPSGSFVGQDCKCYCKQPVVGRDGKPLAVCGTEITDTGNGGGGGGDGGEDPNCKNTKHRCEEYASTGTCVIDPKYMTKYCSKACGFCGGNGGGNGGANSNCEDKKRRCADWAKEGTCQTDRNYMMKYCMKACGFCGEKTGGGGGGGGGTSDCTDNKERCPEYAEWGSCKSDPTYMMRECRKTCDWCNGQPKTNVVEDCVDMKPSCSRWAEGDGCSRDIDYMKKNCRKSCNHCSGKPAFEDPSAGCQDGHRRCAEFSKNNGCSRNPHWMREFCRKTCDACEGRSKFKKVACRDANKDCKAWVDRKMCKAMPDYMAQNCAKSCKFCS